VPAECDEQPVRFGCYTPGLQALVAWLQQGSIETVAMASPGVEWIALFELLESAGIEVILVNAQHLKHVPGRKSDGQVVNGCGRHTVTGCCQPVSDRRR
jgi:transposase